MLLQGNLCTNWKVEVHPFSTQIYSQQASCCSPADACGDTGAGGSQHLHSHPGGQWVQEAAWSIPFTDTSWEAVPGRVMISADDRQLKSVQGGLKGKEKKQARERHVTSHCAVVTLAELWTTALLNAESCSDNPAEEWYGRMRHVSEMWDF